MMAYNAVLFESRIGVSVYLMAGVLLRPAAGPYPPRLLM